MTVIGLTFTSMEASRTDKPVQGEIQVNTSPKIVEVKEIDVKRLGKKTLSMGFEFDTDYSPGYGNLKLKGNVMFIGEKNDEILEQWKKDKKLPDDISVEVLNHLFRKCLVKAAQLADDIQLPPPINIPVVKSESESKGK